MDIFLYIVIAVLSYLLGSFSFSIIFTKKFYNKDVRSEGSGNAGATNVARVFGWKIGLLTLLCDVCKMVVAMLIGGWLCGDKGLAVAAIVGVIGHCFPAYYGFKGGKGVSVALAITAFVDWRITVLCLLVFILMVVITKIVSVSSICGAVTLGVFPFLLGVSTPKIVLSVVTAVIVIFMHRENIKRLIKGEEKKFSFKRN